MLATGLALALAEREMKAAEKAGIKIPARLRDEIRARKQAARGQERP